MFGYIAFCDGFKGQSLGKRLFRIMVIDKDTGELCHPGKSFLRNLIFGFGFLSIFEFIAILTKDRRRIGDRMAGTMVIKEMEIESILDSE